MTGWTPAVTDGTVIIATMLQGVGLGFVFVPLQVIAFATLDPLLRTEGTALLSLLRNVGSAIGISITNALVSQNTQQEHSILSGFITPFNRAIRGTAIDLMPTTPHGAQVLDGMVNRQAQIIAYNNDWKLMMMTALPMLLLLPLMRAPRRATDKSATEHAVMD
jgi:MFS transporter, DHA2 family, multidrug resistance protein